MGCERSHHCTECGYSFRCVGECRHPGKKKAPCADHDPKMNKHKETK